MKDDVYKNTRDKIDERLRQKETQTQPQDAGGVGRKYKSAEAQRVFDNLGFGDTVEQEPILSRKYDKTVFGYEPVNLNTFIHNRIWPRSIYTTDKLVRLAMSARLEFLKRYLSKKRQVPLNMMWILLLIIAVIAVVFIVIFLLPKLGL